MELRMEAWTDLKDDFNGVDVQEHGRVEDAFEHVQLVVDLPGINLVDKLQRKHNQRQNEMTSHCHKGATRDGAYC